MEGGGGTGKILIVDDEAPIRALLTDILQDLGFDSVAVQDGEAAVERVRAEPKAFRLAIVDLVLPGAGGLETLRALRALEPALAGIISSGYEDSISGPAGEAGALAVAARRERFGLLKKPYRVDELQRAIERALGGGS